MSAGSFCNQSFWQHIHWQSQAGSVAGLMYAQWHGISAPRQCYAPCSQLHMIRLLKAILADADTGQSDLHCWRASRLC